MNATLRALVWEQIWKNRFVIPMLLVLLGLSAALAYAIVHAQPDAGWTGQARAGLVVTFMASLLLVFAPFTLMESHSSWRMNSMTTRWFVLPVSTSALVFVSLIVACASMALLVLAWRPILNRIFERFDVNYFLIVSVAGVAGSQMLAWIIPRKPGQYWFIVSVFVPIILLLGVAPQESSDWSVRRISYMQAFAATIPLFALASLYAAQRNRCGDWHGEIPFSKLLGAVRGRRFRLREFKSGVSALFWFDTMTTVFGGLITWMIMAVATTAVAYYMLIRSHPQLSVNGIAAIPFVALQVLPFLAIPWLAAAGLFLGREPGVGFQTRLSSFRSTMPVSIGVLATQRISTALLCWLAVWLPLVALGFFYNTEVFGGSHTDKVTMGAVLARFMAIGAHLLIGGLPIFLWGRFEGFPNMVLSAIVSSSVPFLLSANLQTEEGHAKPWAFAICWMTAKVGVAAWALVHSLRSGHITWRFAAGLFTGWLTVVSLLIWAFPTWTRFGAWGAMGIALFVPLGRLALCPLAISANRHR